MLLYFRLILGVVILIVRITNLGVSSRKKLLLRNPGKRTGILAEQVYTTALPFYPGPSRPLQSLSSASLQSGKKQRSSTAPVSRKGRAGPTALLMQSILVKPTAVPIATAFAAAAHPLTAGSPACRSPRLRNRVWTSGTDRCADAALKLKFQGVWPL